MVTVLLINPYSHSISGVNRATVEPPVGLGYIAALLEAEGYRCQIIDAQILRIPPEKIINYIYHRPVIIGISSNIVNYRASLQTAEFIYSKLKNVPIILGGPHPSSLPEQTLSKSYVQAVAIGESELTMLEIAKRLSTKEHPFKEVRGVVYKDGNRIIFNPSRLPLQDLDSLPFPAYHLLPPLKIYKSRARKKPVGPLLSTRGCPYRCIFCNKNIFGYELRVRSVDNICREIRWLVKNFNIRQLDILDDNFNGNISRAKEVLDMIIKERFGYKYAEWDKGR